MRQSGSSTIALSLALLASAAIVQPVQAQDRAIDVPAAPAGRAVAILARQANVQILLPGRTARGVQTHAVRGAMPVRQALDLMLAGTGLQARQTSPTTWTIVPLDMTAAAAQSSGSRASAEPPESDDAIDAGQEIVVTGTNIRGTPAAGTKVITIDRRTIAESGYARLSDIMENVPQNASAINEDSSAVVSNQTASSEIQLRGLGPGTTLTLVNGQRGPGGGVLGAFTDISNLPISAIERVEILPEGASAIYGSDAIGGVVNIVLRKDFDGAETRVRYGSSDGDARQFMASQLVGRKWASGSVMLGYQFSDRDALYWGDRPRLLGDQRELGGGDYRRTSAARRGGAPGNILPATGTTPAYAIPAGQNGTSLTVAQLLPGAINYMDVSYLTWLPEQRLHSGFASLTQAVGSRIELALDGRYTSRRMTVIGGNQSGVVASVPSTNPFYINPFGGTGPVRVEYDFAPELGPITTTGKNDTWSANFRGQADLGRDWRLVATGSYGQDRTRYELVNRVDTAAVAAALADTNRATSLNVFGNGTANNPATLAKLRLPTLYDYSVNTAWSVGATADGPLFDLPGGPAKLALGGAYLVDRFHLRSNNNFAGSLSDRRTDSAIFAELSLPLLADGRTPLLHALRVSLAGRYDRYRKFGSTFNPKLGATWSLVEGFDVRASYGTSFRAPPFYVSNLDLRAPGRSATNTIDPSAPGGRTNALTLTGVVRDLHEERAKLWTLGVDLKPSRNLSFSGTYFDIDYTGRIGTPINFNTVLVDDSQYAGTGLVIRNPTAAQVAAICNSPEFRNPCSGTYGAIIDNRRRNIAYTRVRGMDLSADYAGETSLGRFNLGLSGTLLFDYLEAISPGSPVADVLDTVRRPISLRMQGNAGWHKDGWSATATVIQAGSYKNPAKTPPAAVDDWTTVNLGLGYRFGDGAPALLRGTELRLSATNVFNSAPPFVDVDFGHDGPNANIIGRTLSIELVRRW